MIYNQKVGLPIYVLTGFFVCIDFFQERDLFRKKEDIHLKPLTPGEALNHIPYIPKSVAGATRRSFTLTLKRCGRDALSKQSGGLFVAISGSNL